MEDSATLTAAEVIKKRGNPNFGKKSFMDDDPIEQEDSFVLSPKKQVKSDNEKIYVFQLLQTHETAKPVDSKSGEKLHNPFQPYYGVPNSGTAYDEDYLPQSEANKPLDKQRRGGQRRWRFLANYPTIWVDEQVDPEPTKEELSDSANDLTFRNGVLVVKGWETCKLQALKMNNMFKDCKNPLKNIPKQYELLDQEQIDKDVLANLDASYEAEKMAREATLEQVYSVAYVFGIDIYKLSDDAVRREFIKAARTNPKVFAREFINPKNKYRYLFQQALHDNMIAPSLTGGKVMNTETGTAIIDVKSTDIAEELAINCLTGDKKSLDIYNNIKNRYKNQQL